MGGDKDFNVPVNGGEQMYQALRSLNVPAELIVYPGQFHGFTRPSFIKIAISAGSTGTTSGCWQKPRPPLLWRPTRKSVQS